MTIDDVRLSIRTYKPTVYRRSHTKSINSIQAKIKVQYIETIYIFLHRITTAYTFLSNLDFGNRINRLYFFSRKSKN